MSRNKPYNFYAVWTGRVPGIYRNWAEADKQVKGFPKAGYKGFYTLEEAEEAMRQHREDSKPSMTADECRAASQISNHGSASNVDTGRPRTPAASTSPRSPRSPRSPSSPLLPDVSRNASPTSPIPSFSPTISTDATAVNSTQAECEPPQATPTTPAPAGQRRSSETSSKTSNSHRQKRYYIKRGPQTPKNQNHHNRDAQVPNLAKEFSRLTVDEVKVTN